MTNFITNLPNYHLYPSRSQQFAYKNWVPQHPPPTNNQNEPMNYFVTRVTLLLLTQTSYPMLSLGGEGEESLGSVAVQLKPCGYVNVIFESCKCLDNEAI